MLHIELVLSFLKAWWWVVILFAGWTIPLAMGWFVSNILSNWGLGYEIRRIGVSPWLLVLAGVQAVYRFATRKQRVKRLQEAEQALREEEARRVAKAEEDQKNREMVTALYGITDFDWQKTSMNLAYIDSILSDLAAQMAEAFQEQETARKSKKPEEVKKADTTAQAMKDLFWRYHHVAKAAGFQVYRSYSEYLQSNI